MRRSPVGVGVVFEHCKYFICNFNWTELKEERRLLITSFDAASIFQFHSELIDCGTESFVAKIVGRVAVQ